LKQTPFENATSLLLEVTSNLSAKKTFSSSIPNLIPQERNKLLTPTLTSE
jgi:hypothetical protein